MPRVITTEISHFSVRYRTDHQKKWLHQLWSLVDSLPQDRKAHSRLKLLEYQLCMPFEWEVAQRYSEVKKILCIAIDSGNLARRDLPLWERDILSEENLLKITSEPNFDLDSHFKDCYAQAETVINIAHKIPKVIHPLSWLSDSDWRTRERLVANRIRRIYRNYLQNIDPHTGLALVHICGWMHLVTGSPWKTLADLLLDLNPTRVLLIRTAIGRRYLKIRDR